jgi:3-oxoacyl-(acyl-carrier-protein) synthase
MKHWVQPGGDTAASVQDLSAAIAGASAPLLDADTDPDERGIYLATGDAGVVASVGFWAAALAESPRFASPADFPWTLANAPAGLLARELAIRGPSYTLVGDADAMLAAFEHAIDDLERGVVAEAIVVACDLEVPAGQRQAAVVVLRAPPRNPPCQPLRDMTASELLAMWCREV